MTKKAKAQRSFILSAIFLIAFAAFIVSSLFSIIAPREPRPTYQPMQDQTLDSYTQYFRHYQVRYELTSENGSRPSWKIASVGFDQTLQNLLGEAGYCDALENNDEAQNCILIGNDTIVDFFQALDELENSNL